MTKVRIALLSTLVLLMATPTFAQKMTKGEVPGIYVLCPRKNMDQCPMVIDDFRYYFPHDQTAPYIMIRQNGSGFWARDLKQTQDFTWTRTEDDILLLDFKDYTIKDIKFKINGSLLTQVGKRKGDVYYMAITDWEWNNPPQKRPEG